MTNQASEDELDQNITDILLEHLVLANDNGQPYIQYTDVAVDKILELIADQVAKARLEFAKSLKSIEYPPSGKEYHFNDGSWTNTLNGVKNNE